jgi:hypothetical protein
MKHKIWADDQLHQSGAEVQRFTYTSRDTDIETQWSAADNA